MRESSPAHLKANVQRFSGFAEVYDRYRPRPPLVLLDILTQVAGVHRPDLVVDLGSGTGLSTIIWAERAGTVIGVEPSEDMRRQAETRLSGAGKTHNIRYRAGVSSDTGLPDAYADIVTCSQALHWMEPESTFAEVARILRSGGVFAAYDCDWPPTTRWEAEQAYIATLQRVHALEKERNVSREVRGWSKDEHLSRMQASGRFRFTKELVLHHVEEGNAERLIGIALSQGGVMALLKHGVGEDEIGLDQLRIVAERELGPTPGPWYWSYRVRMGVK